MVKHEPELHSRISGCPMAADSDSDASADENEMIKSR